ncbi:MAG: carbonic anhydrase [Bacteroidetes bacterium CG18_big_fil_WC_8_21_14_2_50_41_14]|nr:MAG: carbonic anhydrase [Bacteroidetes bacterium CG18_big_fil_WC_8_21_14_2_50_41_14]PJB58714.1 MAG: carbonic anhydrase [Bacteroidetes bacterium CG_4_9_14_3_um_filter_41_19]
MSKLIAINHLDDIPFPYRQTPIGLLVSYHNRLQEFEPYEKAQLLVGMCMDNRKHLHIPDNFTFIIRSGGANLKYSEFKVSYAIAIGDIQHIALIGHNNCGMVNLEARRNLFIEGLIEKAGWDRMFAEEHFNHYAPVFEIGNEINFILSETKRLRLRYPMIMVAPLFYQVEDSKLYFIKETSI